MVRQVVKAKMRTLASGNSRVKACRTFPTQPFPRKRGRVCGFTLLEVLIVLVIGGLLVGVVATSLSEGPVLRKAARDVAASLRHARATAVMHQQPLVWKLDTQAQTYWLDGGKSPEKRQLPKAVTAKLNTSASEISTNGQGGIRFYPDGSSTGGSVELAYNQQTFKINVEWVTGRVSIQ